jgi:hypothetical protein
MDAIVPIPKAPIHIRTATMEDIPFMDSLQKRTSRAVGFMTRKMFEGYVEMKAVLVAERGEEGAPRRHGDTEGGSDADADAQLYSPERGRSDGATESTVERASVPPCLRGEPLCGERLCGERLGYVISRDRYLKRDELGIIYQMNIAPQARRMLVGAALVREAFARSAWGCRLYCLWCAQDLEANRFWEAMGFVPIAFRAGSSGKKRVHIFWQRRIDEDDEVTPYWYPYQTNQGAIREDRLVWPIPPGVRWEEVRPVELPATQQAPERPCSPAPLAKRSRGAGVQGSGGEKKHAGPGPGMVGIVVGGRIKYVPRPGYVAPASAVALTVPLALPAPERKCEPRPKAAGAKLDPALLKKVRELRDRWVEYAGVHGVPSAGRIEQRYALGRGLQLPDVQRGQGVKKRLRHIA